MYCGMLHCVLNWIVLPEASRQYLHYYYAAKAPIAQLLCVRLGCEV